jgi:hypothetical protein
MIFHQGPLSVSVSHKADAFDDVVRASVDFALVAPLYPKDSQIVTLGSGIFYG